MADATVTSEDPKRPAAAPSKSPPTCKLDDEVICRALKECTAMVDRVRNSEKALPPEVMLAYQVCAEQARQGQEVDVAVLTDTHNKLAALIFPAAPRSVLYLQEQRKNYLVTRFLGPIPIIRQMMIVSILSLLGFIYLSASDRVNQEILGTTLFNREGEDQVTIAFFFLAAAAIGACFANLFKAYRYVTEGTYNPELDMSYWMRVILGLMAGYILAELITLDIETKLGKPLLAILGGFSASAVHKLLERLVLAVESIVAGDLKARVKAQSSRIKTQLEGEAAQEKMVLAAELMEARAKLKQGGDTAVIDEDLDKLLKSILASAGAGPK